MTNNPSLDAILDAREDGPETIAYIANLAAEAKSWADSHTTKIDWGKNGHVQPELPTPNAQARFNVAIRRDATDQWAGTFETILEELLTAATEDGDGLPAAILAIHAFTGSGRLLALYHGIVKSYDAETVTFYDGQTIDRENVVGMAI